LISLQLAEVPDAQNQTTMQVPTLMHKLFFSAEPSPARKQSQEFLTDLFELTTHFNNTFACHKTRERLTGLRR
jgi:hypothetical protein